MAEIFGLSHQVFVAGFVELIMILLTMTLLDPPASVISARSTVLHAAVKGAGMILLCLTFCWSFILGCVLALNSGTYRL